MWAASESTPLIQTEHVLGFPSDNDLDHRIGKSFINFFFLTCGGNSQIEPETIFLINTVTGPKHSTNLK